MAEKLPFEQTFPYISYRWLYDDGQYSPFAPFSRAAFVAKEHSDEELFKNGYNTSMVNSLKVINVNNISRGGPDVIAVDVLYRESISSTVYVLETIDIPENERGGSAPLSIQIESRSFGRALPANQLSRHFDNVPRKAKSQEVTANRLIYGNYIQKYDLAGKNQTSSNLDIEVKTGIVIEPKSGPSVKTNRTYEVGVVYLDKYGRHSSLQTQKSTETGKGSNFISDFSTPYRTKLKAKINSKAPDWAKSYKYYVKDTSNEHFNLTSFNVYNNGNAFDDESDEVWVQFNSSDRNKITEDTILLPKSSPLGQYKTESRLPVLGVENEAPDIVKAQVTEKEAVSIGSIFSAEANTVASLSSTSEQGWGINTTDIFVAGVAGQLSIVNKLNAYISEQEGSGATLLNDGDPNDKATQTIDVSNYAEKLCLQPVDKTPSSSGSYKKVLVSTIKYGASSGSNQRNVLQFTLTNQLDGDFVIESGTGLSIGINLNDDDKSLKFYKLGLSEDGANKIRGSFFVKIPRETDEALTSMQLLPTGLTPFDEDGKVHVSKIKKVNFETEPIGESSLDLYWESSQTYNVKGDHGQFNDIVWANCIATMSDDLISPYIDLESINIYDKFNSVSIAKGTRVITPEARYAEEHRKAGLIFSGLYNSKTGINELNQFIEADGITKELEPNYGSIQKLYTLDTNLLAFAENKVFRILADKDALFNADDGVNVTATNRVLGQAMVYQGNYGISKNPESLVYFENRLYFSDSKRGVIVQLTPANGQLFPISSRGMSNFFRDRIGTADKLIGMYDGAKKLYTLSMQGYDASDAAIGTESISGETETTSQVTLPDYSTGLILVDNNAGQPAGEMLITGPGYSSGTETPVDLTTISATDYNILTFNFPTEEKANSFRTAIGWPDSGVTTAGSDIGPFTISFSGGQKIVITQPAGNLSTNSGRTVVIGNNDAGTLNNPIYGIGSGIVTPISGWPAAVTSSLGDFGGVSTSVSTSAGGLTLGYSPRVEGWVSRYSFIPEDGVTLNNKFYTFKNGKAYVHYDDSVNRNTFYGTFGNSEIELIFNDDPMAVKEFLTLAYEGTSGWDVSKIDTESDDAALTSTWPFVKKESKYFAPIVSQENYYGSTDQSLGSATADDGSTVYVQGTRDKSGIKGFYNKVRLENDSTSKAELFAVNTENFISQT